MRSARRARRGLVALVFLAAAIGPAAVAAPYPPPPEPAMQQELLDARWPADIVAVGERYVASYPVGPYTVTARAELERARATPGACSSAATSASTAATSSPGAPRPTLYDDVRKAALADKEAAARVARLYRDGEGGVAANVDRYVGWMQYAAALGHAEASYELALYYRKASLPALAAPYEARAEELGFKPPPTLDHIRK